MLRIALGGSFISMVNKRITPAVLATLYKAIEDGAIVTDAALVANISRQAYYGLIWASGCWGTRTLRDNRQTIGP